MTAAVALAVAGCGNSEDTGGDIVPSTGTDGQTTPATVPNGSGTPSSSTAGTSPTVPSGTDDAPQSEEEQEGEQETTP